MSYNKKIIVRMSSLQDHIDLARRITYLMDTKFSVFGIKFGIDPLLDVIPGLGNILGAATSCYLFWIARQLHAPRTVYWKMAWNITLDYLLGAIPVAGILADLFYRSNVKNFALLEKYFDPSIIEGELISG